MRLKLLLQLLHAVSQSARCMATREALSSCGLFGNGFAGTAKMNSIWLYCVWNVSYWILISCLLNCHITAICLWSLLVWYCLLIHAVRFFLSALLEDVTDLTVRQYVNISLYARSAFTLCWKSVYVCVIVDMVTFFSILCNTYQWKGSHITHITTPYHWLFFYKSSHHHALFFVINCDKWYNVIFWQNMSVSSWYPGGRFKMS